MNNSPKIYTLQCESGRFVQHHPIFGYNFCFKLHDAKFCRKEKEIEIIKPQLEKELGKELFLVVATEEEFWISYGLTATQAIISEDYFIKFLETINYNVPYVSQINKNIKNSIQNVLNNLKNVNEKFNDFRDKKEDQTYEVSAYYEEMILEIAKLDFHECHNITNMLKAYRKDPKSLQGIVKKINQ